MTKIINHLQSLIASDLQKLENSNMRAADLKKYEELKKKYQDLSTELVYFENSFDLQGMTLNPKTVYAYLNKYANISSDFDFYLTFLGGSKKITAYQIKKVTSSFEELLNKINKNNYNEVNEELDNTINLYKNVMGEVLDISIIKDLITKIRYLIIKYTLSEEFLYKNFDDEDFFSYIYDDINKCLNDPNILQIYKDELRKYFLSSNLIKSNFNKILIIIILAENNYDLSKEELEAELNRNYFNKEDTLQEYGNENIDIAKIKKFNSILATNPKEACSATKLYDYKLITESVLTDYKSNIDKLLELRNHLVENGFDCDYEIGCGIIAAQNSFAHVDRNALFDLIENENIELVRVIYQSLINIGSINFVIGYLYENNDKILLEKIALENNILDFIHLYLNNSNAYINLLPIIKSVITKLSWDDLKAIIQDNLSFKKEEFSWLLDNMENIELKNKLDDYIYAKLDNSDNQLYVDYVNPNKYEAYYISCNWEEYLNEANIEQFLDNNSKYKLNWGKLLVLADKLPDNLANFVYKKCYQNNLEALINHKPLDSYSKEMAKEMVDEFPQSIIYFIESLDLDDIIELPESTLQLFSTNFEKDYNIDNSILIKFLENSDKQMTKKCCTYIMHKGILNIELIDIIDSKDLLIIYKRLFKNLANKLERPRLFRLLSKKINDISLVDANVMYLSYSEINDYQNSNEAKEVIDLNLEKYALDLIRNIDLYSTDNNIFEKIIKEVGKLGFIKPIKYLVEKYPNSISLLIDYISDENVRDEIESLTENNGKSL